jgi:WD40 repeat protein
MAPEQALACHGLVDHRADVYGLGCTLYELLTGRPAVDATDRAEILRRIAFEDPTPLRKLDRATPAELETITLKAMAKTPAERYATAVELADDLRLWLEHKTIRARSAGLVRRMTRWCRRHRALAAMYGLVVLVLMFGMLSGVVAWLWRVAETARGQAENSLHSEKQARAGEADARRQLASALYLNRVNLAHRAWSENHVTRARLLLDLCPPSLRNWEWRYVQSLCNQEVLAQEHRGMQFLAYSPDGRRWASIRVGMVKVLDLESGRELSAHTCEGNSVPLEFSPDGQYATSWNHPHGNNESEINVWDADTNLEILTLQKLGFVTSVAISRDRAFLAASINVNAVPLPAGLPFGASYNPSVASYLIKVWDVRTGRECHTLKAQSANGHHAVISNITFSDDGKRLISVCRKQLGNTIEDFNFLLELKGWDLTTGQECLAFTVGESERLMPWLTFSPDGHCFATATRDHVVQLRTVANPVNLRSFKGHTDRVAFQATFSPDGKFLATGSLDKTIRVWDVVKGEEFRCLKVDTDNIRAFAFRRDGQSLVSWTNNDRGQRPETVLSRVWDLTVQEPHVAIAQRGQNGADFSADRRYLAYNAILPGFGKVTGDGVRVWDLAAGQEVFCRTWPTPLSGCVAISPDGKLVAITLDDSTVQIWNVATGVTTHSLQRQAVPRLARRTALPRLAFSPDGRHLVSADGVHDKVISVWDLTTSLETHTLTTPGFASRLAFSPDGSRVAICMAQDVIVWDWSTGNRTTLSTGNPARRSGLAFTPNGRYLALGSEKKIQVWDLTKCEELLPLSGHTASVYDVTFSPTGDRLASVATDGSVKVWDWMAGEEALTLAQPGVTSNCRIAFSADGQQLLCCCHHNTLVWDATPVQARRGAAASP